MTFLENIYKSRKSCLKNTELENLNHFFHKCETGSMDEYRKIEQTFSSTALKEISNWIFSVTE